MLEFEQFVSDPAPNVLIFVVGNIGNTTSVGFVLATLRLEESVYSLEDKRAKCAFGSSIDSPA